MRTALTSFFVKRGDECNVLDECRMSLAIVKEAGEPRQETTQKEELLKNDAALQLNLVGWPFHYETGIERQLGVQISSLISDTRRYSFAWLGDSSRYYVERCDGKDPRTYRQEKGEEGNNQEQAMNNRNIRTSGLLQLYNTYEPAQITLLGKYI